MTRRRALLLLTSVLVALALYALLPARVPITPDEIGYLAIAKVLAGGEAFNLSAIGQYRSGQGILLAPAFLAGLEGEAVYRYGVAVSCLATALVPLVLLRIGKFVGVEPTWSVIASAFLVAVLPAYFYHASMVWTEATFRLFFVVAVALVAQAWNSRSSLWWILAGTSVGVLYALHARALLILPLFALLVALAFRRRVVSAIGLAAALGALGAVVISTALIDRHVHLSLWGRTGGDVTLVKTMLSTLSSDGGLRRLLAVSFGQFWGLLAASYGLVFLGLVSAAAMVWNRPETRPALLFAILAAASVFVASVGQMISFTRVDHVIYNRYTDGASTLFVWLGLVALVRGEVTTRIGAVVIGVLLLAGFAALAFSRGFPLSGLVTPNIPAHLWMNRITPIGSATLPQIVLLGTLLAIAVLALCLSHRRTAALAIVAGACLIIGADVRTSAILAHLGRELHSNAAATVYSRATGPVYWDRSAPSPGNALMDQYIIFGHALPTSDVSVSDIPYGSAAIAAPISGYDCTLAIPGGNTLCVRD